MGTHPDVEGFEAIAGRSAQRHNFGPRIRDTDLSLASFDKILE